MSDRANDAGSGEPGGKEYAAEISIAGLRDAPGWVSLIGTVISREPSRSEIVIDDGTGQAPARVPSMPELGRLVRLVGRVYLSSGEVGVHAEILQDFSGFDVDLYRKVLDMEERVYRGEEDYRR